MSPLPRSFLPACFAILTLAAGHAATSGAIQAAPTATATSVPSPGASPTGTHPIPWEAWSPTAFQRAKLEHRFVLLYLEAVWCHWCHVMDHDTYRDPAVVKLLNAHFVPVRVDQDSQPDLANRYRDYGWPATIVFSPEGLELLKRRGYIPPDEMATLLQGIVDDPRPEHDDAPPDAGETSPPASVNPASSPVGSSAAAPSRPVSPGSPASNPSALPESLRLELLRRHLASDDLEQGGLKLFQKFIDSDTVEFALMRAGQGDEQEADLARRTLAGALHLIDPVWGGMYQYSVQGRWDRPHFEKIMSIQTHALTTYALAWARLPDPRWQQAARDIHRYLRTFLTSPEGALYTSQDADLTPGEHSLEYFALDDADRRARGLPRIDTHRYARENGQAITALCAWYEASGEQEALEDARRAALWVIANRALPGGGFRHDEIDAAGPFLGDTLAMGRAFLALYRGTGERDWLARATGAATYIDRHFAAAGAGDLTSISSSQGRGPGDSGPPDPEAGGRGFVGVAPGGSLLPPRPDLDENIALARFANLLSRFTGDPDIRAMATRAIRYLAIPAVATDRLTDPGILLADLELTQDPLHITVVGAKGDGAARGLFQAALRRAGWYKRVEWWDPSEGPMPATDVQYPVLELSAAFVCAAGRCSAPVFKPADLEKTIVKILR